MPFYIVKIPTGLTARVLQDGKDVALVWAESEDDAKDIVKSSFDGDSNSLWEGSTVTEVEAPADMEGWTVRVVVTDPEGENGPEIVADVEATGAEGDDITDILADVATALNALDNIDGAAFATATLKVAETTDNLGDHEVAVYVLAPGYDDPKSIEGFVTTITDGGAADDALTVLFDTARVIPAIVGSFRA
jgi:hypothetical protein